MSKLTITEESRLTPAEVKKLQAKFTKFEAKMEKLRPLENKVVAAQAVIDNYLSKLYEIGQDFESEFSEHSHNIEINDDGVYFGDYPEAAVANAFNFWIPSSMSC
jgi:hypothetical protein